jgi:hypothetical protein
LRIRIAASNYDREGFKSEVRAALTQTAFSVASQSKSFFQTKGRIENPLPDHPSSDRTTSILNKVLENPDAILKKGDNDEKQKERHQANK